MTDRRNQPTHSCQLALRFLGVAILVVAASCSTGSTPQPGGQGSSPPVNSRSAAATEFEWLTELNKLRAIGGLKPVADDPQLSTDCRAHAKYLIDQGPEGISEFIDYRTTLGLRAHEEDPHSKYYSSAGAECAEGGKPQPGFSGSNDVAWGRDPINDLDGLFYDAPFHRLSLLASWATMAGYGQYGVWPRRVGVLALRGPGGIGSPLTRFPADGSTVPVGKVASFEIPDPLASCPGYQLPTGLPITMQLGSGYRGKLASYWLRGPAGPLETCAFDWSSYQNENASIQEHARKVLRMFGAIVLVPRQPLTNGRYTVFVDTARQKLEWTFTVENQQTAVTLR